MRLTVRAVNRVCLLKKALRGGPDLQSDRRVISSECQAVASGLGLFVDHQSYLARQAYFGLGLSGLASVDSGS